MSFTDLIRKLSPSDGYLTNYIRSGQDLVSAIEEASTTTRLFRLPAGRFVINRPIELHSGQVLTGDNAATTTIVTSGEFYAVVVNANEVFSDRVGIHDIGFDGNNTGNGIFMQGERLFEGTNTRFNDITNCVFVNNKTAIDLTNVLYSNIEGNKFYLNNNGIKVRQQSLGLNISKNSFIGRAWLGREFADGIAIELISVRKDTGGEIEDFSVHNSFLGNVWAPETINMTYNFGEGFKTSIRAKAGMQIRMIGNSMDVATEDAFHLQGVEGFTLSQNYVMSETSPYASVLIEDCAKGNIVDNFIPWGYAGIRAERLVQSNIHRNFLPDYRDEEIKLGAIHLTNCNDIDEQLNRSF
jgi:hypothetical protein